MNLLIIYSNFPCENSACVCSVTLYKTVFPAFQVTKAISCISGTSNATSVISPLNLLQGRLCVNQKLGGESHLFAPFLWEGRPRGAWGGDCKEAPGLGPHTASALTISAVEDLRSCHFLLQTLLGCEGWSCFSAPFIESKNHGMTSDRKGS